MLKNFLRVAVIATALVASASAANDQSADSARAAGQKTAPAGPVASHAPATATMLAAEQTAVVKQYCSTCHSERGKAGGISVSYTHLTLPTILRV